MPRLPLAARLGAGLVTAPGAADDRRFVGENHGLVSTGNNGFITILTDGAATGGNEKLSDEA